MNNTAQSLSQNDIIQLKDCISFVLDKDEDLDQESVNELWQLNMKLTKQLEEKYKELDEINQLKSLLKEDKVYPQVDNIPEQVYQDWLYNKEANNK